MEKTEGSSVAPWLQVEIVCPLDKDNWHWMPEPVVLSDEVPARPHAPLVPPPPFVCCEVNLTEALLAACPAGARIASVRLSPSDRVAEETRAEFRVCFGDNPRTDWGSAHSLLYRRVQDLIDQEVVLAESMCMQRFTLDCVEARLTYDGSAEDTRARSLKVSRIDNLRVCFRMSASALAAFRPSSFVLRLDVL